MDKSTQGEIRMGKLQKIIDMVKGKTFPMGTVRTHKDGKKYKKLENGKWREIVDTVKGKKAEPKGKKYSVLPREVISVMEGRYNAKRVPEKDVKGCEAWFHAKSKEKNHGNDQSKYMLLSKKLYKKKRIFEIGDTIESCVEQVAARKQFIDYKIQERRIEQRKADSQ